jgi:hypothetical protein
MMMLDCEVKKSDILFTFHNTNLYYAILSQALHVNLHSELMLFKINSYYKKINKYQSNFVTVEVLGLFIHNTIFSVP